MVAHATSACYCPRHTIGGEGELQSVLSTEVSSLLFRQLYCDVRAPPGRARSARCACGLGLCAHFFYFCFYAPATALRSVLPARGFCGALHHTVDIQYVCILPFCISTTHYNTSPTSLKHRRSRRRGSLARCKPRQRGVLPHAANTPKQQISELIMLLLGPLQN
jgi:hypothetical protein